MNVVVNDAVGSRVDAFLTSLNEHLSFNENDSSMAGSHGVDDASIGNSVTSRYIC